MNISHQSFFFVAYKRMTSSHCKILRSLIVSSADRDPVVFPTPQSYHINILPLKYVGSAFVAMANFVTPVAPPLVAVLRINELSGSGLSATTWPGGGDTVLAVIPLPAAGLRVQYINSDARNTDVLRARDVEYYWQLSSLTISWTDEAGAPIVNMPEHVIRLMFEGENTY